MITHSPKRNPYKGLHAFTQEDTNYFFGREALTQKLLARMDEQGDFSRFLAVIGPSGSGKSSVIQAGLIPALEKKNLLRSRRQCVVQMTPGTQPMEELEAGLLAIAQHPPADLLNRLNRDDHGLVREANLVLPHNGTELVIIIDQFEELFAPELSRRVQAQFLNCLYATITDPHSRIWIIITLQTNYQNRLFQYRTFREMLSQRHEIVLALNPQELERAIVNPAEREDVDLETGLCALIMSDVMKQSGALPQLQYALTELFEQRQGRTMTLEAYQRIGGVEGVLASRADHIYERMIKDEQEVVKQLFLRLVTVDEGIENTRRVRRAELDALAPNISSEALTTAIGAYGRHRLLTFDSDPVTKEPTVEIAHDALIHKWSRFHREWLTPYWPNLLVRDELRRAAGDWNNANKERSFLARGTRLTRYEELDENAGKPSGLALTSMEREYIATSVAERRNDQNVETKRREREHRMARRLARTKRTAKRSLGALVLAVGLILGTLTLCASALDLANMAVSKAEIADTNATRANNNATVAVASQRELEAQRLAEEANRLLREDGNAELIALLSIRSMNTRYSPEADAALEGAATLEFPTFRLVGHTDDVLAGVYSPDGKYVVTGSSDNTVRLWSALTGYVLHVFRGHTDQVNSVAYSPDGKYILTGSNDNTARLWDATARLFDAHPKQEVRLFIGHTNGVEAVA
ncbi:MAG: AAA family ATPase, partial [Chloroflexia bacterium]